MKNKKIKLIALLLLGIGFNQGYAQQAISVTGGDASSSGGSVAYSVGQVVYTTSKGSNGSVAQGVQQPYEISVTIGINETSINLEMSVYPNPTINYLTLEVNNNSNLSYQLYDLQGKVIENKKVKANTTIIKMEELLNATYFLKVTDDNKIIKTFKIIKN